MKYRGILAKKKPHQTALLATKVIQSGERTQARIDLEVEYAKTVDALFDAHIFVPRVTPPKRITVLQIRKRNSSPISSAILLRTAPSLASFKRSTPSSASPNFAVYGVMIVLSQAVLPVDRSTSV